MFVTGPKVVEVSRTCCYIVVRTSCIPGSDSGGGNRSGVGRGTHTH